MLKSLLMVVTWLQGGPVVQTQLLDSPAQCRLAAQSAAQMIQLQARSNLNSPHSDLLLTQDPRSREWSPSTGAVGREVARLRCAEPDAQPALGAWQSPRPMPSVSCQYDDVPFPETGGTDAPPKLRYLETEQ